MSSSSMEEGGGDDTPQKFIIFPISKSGKRTLKGDINFTLSNPLEAITATVEQDEPTNYTFVISMLHMVYVKLIFTNC